MTFWKVFWRAEPIQVLFLACSLGLTAYSGFLVNLYANPLWSYFVTGALYLAVGLVFFQWFGKWKEGITISLFAICLLQFSFREEMNELQFLQKTANQKHPTNNPKDGDPFFYLEGYDYASNRNYTNFIRHESRDQKGRDNSHTNHFYLVPLIHRNFPNEPIRFLYIAPNAYLYNQWHKEKTFPKFTRV